MAIFKFFFKVGLGFLALFFGLKSVAEVASKVKE